MLSENRPSSRSNTGSAQSNSVGAAPLSKKSSRSQITEEDDEDSNRGKSKIPPPPPIPSFLRASSQPSRTLSTGASSVSSESSTPTKSTTKPTSDALRVLSSSEESDSARQTTVIALKHKFPSKKPTKKGDVGRVSAKDFDNEKSTPTYHPLRHQDGRQQSIFEKIDTHGGGASYLGKGTFTQLEDCIRQCLARDQGHRPTSHHPKSSTHASVLEDYSYDGIIPSHHPHLHRSNSAIDHAHHRKKSAADLSLTEIRHINDALTKYGISVFSHDQHRDDVQHAARPVSEILSACRLLMHEPTLAPYRQGPSAVQNTWNSIQHAYPGQQPAGYSSPALRGVASHLFNPTQQTQYDPVHGVASHLFGSSSPNAYNPVQGVASHLFSGPPQPQYSPGSPFNAPYRPY